MQTAHPPPHYCVSRRLVEDPAAEEDDHDIDEVSSLVITPRKRRITASASSSKEATSPASKKPRATVPTPATPETSVCAKSILSSARKTQKIQSPLFVVSSSSPGPKGPVRAADVKRPLSPVESHLAHDHARVEAVLKEHNIIKPDESEAESEVNPFALDPVEAAPQVVIPPAKDDRYKKKSALEEELGEFIFE
ncbi:hypothetical protein N7478_009610 [Penicillium angulare]|uniref:uncharacterized protein n=1 Tax=Penicillium angulare TaxID=116970 RepID=UPI002540AF57|nr:uncharacterized protein N7478_009610 [Penicillium angulare]KAJ5266802.1 hypothetical protein N7478_009610 [Penicillium angulare]